MDPKEQAEDTAPPESPTPPLDPRRDKILNEADRLFAMDVKQRLPAILADSRKWVMPGPDYTGSIVLYEDFPYAYWEDFSRLSDMPPDAFAALPADVSLQAEFADVSDMLENKIRGIALYESQMERLFNDEKAMADAVRQYAKKVGQIGSVPGGIAERYWVTTRA